MPELLKSNLSPLVEALHGDVRGIIAQQKSDDLCFFLTPAGAEIACSPSGVLEDGTRLKITSKRGADLTALWAQICPTSGLIYAPKVPRSIPELSPEFMVIAITLCLLGSAMLLKSMIGA